MTLLPVHIIAGLAAIASGFLALFAFKGAKLHRKSGTMFVYSMLVLGVTGAVIATLKSQPANVIGGTIAVYFVTTGLLTLRRRDERSRSIDAAAMLVAIAIGFLSLTLGLRVYHSASGNINGVPPAPLFVFGAVAFLAAAGDLRSMVVQGLQGKHRIARHVWRLCFALFIASGSFFLGQAKVFPKPIRIMPLLAIPALLPLVLLIYWMVRVLFTKWHRRHPRDSFKPIPLRRPA